GAQRAFESAGHRHWPRPVVPRGFPPAKLLALGVYGDSRERCRPRRCYSIGRHRSPRRACARTDSNQRDSKRHEQAPARRLSGSLRFMAEARTSNRLRLLHLAQRIRVPSGLVLAPLLIIAARPSPRLLVVGAVIAAVGLWGRAWASGYLRKNQELTVTGPY